MEYLKLNSPHIADNRDGRIRWSRIKGLERNKYDKEAL